MKKKSIGLLTIGQSPRVDFTPSIQHILGDTVDIVEAGGLDRIGNDDFHSITPDKDEITYISKLINGQSIKIGKSKLLPLLQEELNKLEEQVSAVIMLCTGDFPSIISNKPLIYPDKILSHTVQAILPKGKLGIVIPLEEQRNTLTQKWKSTGVKFCVEVASPYEDSDIKGAAQKLKNQGVELIVLDCMGYNETHKRDAMDGSGLPVLLPLTLTARIVAEYV
ncbi:AroM family protein [Peribacillus muralis]|uniref:AroM family protein n=1 Tax=Peribacillus muralis TaxID=264697 RepID=UPI001F4D4BE1|nr:AroM family protein [Peribacillus muralis]MCK1993561.1 AroM family protein [Peribacillus muralis]MCK2014151.1 AroM family protein [Peribacillus muralis]